MPAKPEVLDELLLMLQAELDEHLGVMGGIVAMPAQYACDDFTVIRENLERIRKEEQPMCPRTPSRLLHTCLRVEPQCPVECPHHNDWIGPNG